MHRLAALMYLNVFEPLPLRMEDYRGCGSLSNTVRSRGFVRIKVGLGNFFA